MEKYSAYIQHSEDTVRRLAKMQYELYQNKKRYTILIVGVAIAALGLIFRENNVLFVIFMLIGCWVAMSTSIPAKMTAQKMIDAFNGSYPKTNYSFEEDKIVVSGKTYRKNGQVKYDRIISLSQDERYLYFFIDKRTAHMIDKDTLQPKEYAEFSSFLQRKSNCKWKNPRPLLFFRLSDLGINIFKKSKGGGASANLSGPRLGDSGGRGFWNWFK